MGKINASDKIVFENQKKRENIYEIFSATTCNVHRPTVSKLIDLSNFV